MTLPNLTMLNLVLLASEFMDWIMISANLLVAPIILVGRTALSVEIITKEDTEFWIDKVAKLNVPIILFSHALVILFKSSTRGTCLYAAAWYTQSI